MSIEIDVLNGDASWKRTEPLHNAVYGKHIMQTLPWGHVVWANADLRVLIDAPEGELACHVGIYFRTINWNGHDIHVGGIGGEIWCEQPNGRVRFTEMSPFVFDIRRAPRDGVIDLKGLPW